MSLAGLLGGPSLLCWASVLLRQIRVDYTYVGVLLHSLFRSVNCFICPFAKTTLP